MGVAYSDLDLYIEYRGRYIYFPSFNKVSECEKKILDSLLEDDSKNHWTPAVLIGWRYRVSREEDLVH